MENDKLLQRLEALEKEIKELKAKQKDSWNLFGRSYHQVGETSSDFLIKTKGQVKIQWGNKFIDLIKDGKINADLKFIYKGSPGSKNGIYIDDEGGVWIVVDGQSINIKGEIGTTFVSFLALQDTSDDQKSTAQINIGLLAKSYSDINITSGLVYVQSEQKLYMVSEGKIQELTFEFPNPFKEQFIISKNDDKKGSLLILGKGINNSLAFDGLYIYTDDNSYFDSEKTIEFKINNKTKFKIDSNYTTFLNTVIGNFIQSNGATNQQGFRLYIADDGQSVLEIDKLIVRKSSSEVQNIIYPTIWSKCANIMTSCEEIEDETLGIGFQLGLKYENKYQIGDCLYLYGQIEVSEYDIKVVKIPVKVEAIDTENSNSIYVSVLTDLLEDTISTLPSFAGYPIFLISTDEEITLLRYSEDNLDLLQYENVEDEKELDSIQTRIGNLTELEKELNDNNSEDPVKVEGEGLYSKQGLFNEVAYEKDYELDEEDDSSRLASTEWVNLKLKSTNVDVDFAIETITIKPEDYFTQDWIKELLTEQNDDTSKTYLGINGILTIVKTSSKVFYSAIVKAKTDISDYSHRSINAIYNNTTNTWELASTYIIRTTAGTIWGQRLKVVDNNEIVGNMINVGNISFQEGKSIGSMTNGSVRPNNLYANSNVVISSYDGNPWDYTLMKDIGAAAFLNNNSLQLHSIVDYYNDNNYFNNPRILWNVYNPKTVQREGHWWLGPNWHNGDTDRYDSADGYKNFMLYPSFVVPDDMKDEDDLPTADFFKQFNFIINSHTTAMSFIKHGGTSNQFLMADGNVKELSELSTMSLPVGSVIMFDSSYEIPDGWEIYENSDKSSEINVLSLDNISDDTQNDSELENNPLIFIRKIY